MGSFVFDVVAIRRLSGNWCLLVVMSFMSCFAVSFGVSSEGVEVVVESVICLMNVIGSLLFPQSCPARLRYIALSVLWALVARMGFWMDMYSKMCVRVGFVM